MRILERKHSTLTWYKPLVTIIKGYKQKIKNFTIYLYGPRQSFTIDCIQWDLEDLTESIWFRKSQQRLTRRGRVYDRSENLKNVGKSIVGERENENNHWVILDNTQNKKRITLSKVWLQTNIKHGRDKVG